MAAACSNERLIGLGARRTSVVVAYSAKLPGPEPNTSSPGLTSVTFLPTASTCPARSTPRTLEPGTRSSLPMRWGSLLRSRCQSSALTEAALTLTSTWSSPATGFSISRSSRTSGDPYPFWTTAFISTSRSSGTSSVIPKLHTPGDRISPARLIHLAMRSSSRGPADEPARRLILKDRRPLTTAASLGLLLGTLTLRADEPPKIQIPQPGVPQIMTMEGRFVRAAYNNEGYGILGYRVANQSVGEKWMLLEVGLALRDGVPDYTMTREALSLETPDGKTIPLATLKEYREAQTAALEARAKMQRDSINYFPPNAVRACRIGFFADVDSREKAWDQVDLTSQTACMGRLFFQVPDGIQHGQHWLNVKFAQSVVRVPFRILTDE